MPDSFIHFISFAIPSPLDTLPLGRPSARIMELPYPALSSLIRKPSLAQPRGLPHSHPRRRNTQRRARVGFLLLSSPAPSSPSLAAEGASAHHSE